MLANDQNNIKRNPYILYFLYFVCLTSLLTTLFLGAEQSEAEKNLQLEAQAQAKQHADMAVIKIESIFDSLKVIVDDIAATLEQEKLSEAQLRKLFDQQLDKNNQLELKQLGLAYKPYAYDASRKLYSPAYNINDSKREYIGATYDYTLPSPDNSWFHQPMNAQHPVWLEPYFGKDANDWLAEYGVPFKGINAKTGKQEQVGVISANLSLARVRELVSELNFGVSGYGFILTTQGTIVSHPLAGYLGKNINCSGSSKQSDCLKVDDTFIKQSFEMARTGQKGNYRSIRNKNSGQNAWVYLLPIKSTSWSMAIVLNESDFLVNADTVRQQQLQLLSSALIFLIAVTLILLRIDKANARNLMAASALISLYSLVAIIIVWNVSINIASNTDYSVQTPFNEKDVAGVHSTNIRNFKVYDQASAESVLSSCKTSNSGITEIPTGVFIQSINFTGANDVAMTGYVWQKLAKKPTHSDKLDIAIILPEAENTSIELAYEKKLSNNMHLIGWYFSATLRQQFGYQKYPFDREDVWLRIWANDMNRGTILVPDFISYKTINPDKMPGLEENFVLQGWELENSYFSYRPSSYNVDFGYDDHGAKDTCPELYFNVGIKRNFISPFISDILPIVIIILLVFAVLMISTKHDKKMEVFGFSTSSVLGYCAALFFVLIVSHVHLRETLAAHSIIYMEYFYFVTYLIILLSSANAVIFASDRYIHLIHYKDNFYIKLSYWPLLLLSLVIATIHNFY